MPVTPVASSQTQTQQGATAATANQTTQDTSTTTAATNAKTNSKPDNDGDHDGDKVSLSDAAAKLLAANKKVNPDGTVGPHHKPRHPNAAPKPV